VLILTLTWLTILLVAALAHVGGRRAPDGGVFARIVDSRGIVVVVFVTTFLVLWYSWAAWNPIPVVHDEMAYVLQAQIFARGRWANPTPPFPLFWEQAHVLVEPAVAAKYFPGHALVLTLGALVGWPALVPLLLQSTSASLLYVLARRVASGGVAFLAWIIWLFTPMVMYFGASYFAQTTSTAAWLAGWYALLRWRDTRRTGWIVALGFFAGWVTITRPLTGVAYLIPVGFVVLRDVITLRRWRDLALAFAMGTAVIGILPLWSAKTTGDWRVTPQTLYTRMYMPYDVPGFGYDSTPPTHSITPELAQLNGVYGSVHVTHFPKTLPAALLQRSMYLSISVWGVSSGIIGVFALLGLLTLRAETAVAAASAVLLVLAYLVYATPPQWTLYYFESVPSLVYLSAAGMAWAASLAARPRTAPPSVAFNWRSPVLARALVLGALGLALPGLISLRIIHGQHIGDRKFLTRFDKLLASIHDERAVVFVRYAGTHNPHVTFVRNVADPGKERIWVVYDRGDAENAKFLAAAPGRTSYLFDELRGQTFVYDPSAIR
jgi:hypothetical protein